MWIKIRKIYLIIWIQYYFEYKVHSRQVNGPSLKQDIIRHKAVPIPKLQHSILSNHH